MNWRKMFMYLSAVMLLSGLLPVLSFAQGGTGQTAVATKIEADLLDQLAARGTADMIVVMAEQADLSPAYQMNWQKRGEFVYRTLSETAHRSQARVKALVDRHGLRYQTFIAGNELYVWSGNLQVAQSLAALPEVAYIRAPRVYKIDPPVATGQPQATFDWGILDTQADQFWASFGFKGEEIVVANIDTGVDYTHDALQPNYKCLANPSDPSCWYDPGTQDCTGPDGGPCDTPYFGIYHGTHTMGTMAAKDDPALEYTVGMAPNARWIACLGCPYGSCPEFDLNACADWMLAPGGDPNNRPHVVNNSWGGWGGDPWYLPKVEAWRAAGIFPAFAAGNSGPSCSSLGSPGDYQESFGSAAHDSSRNIAYFSSRGPSAFGDDPYTKPNISAPGVDIISTAPGDTWVSMSGTSMASPHSAGAVALLWSCNPGLIGQIDQTFEILQGNADSPPPGNCGAPPDGEGNYTYGYGYLNIYNAALSWCGSVGYLDGHVTDASTGNPIAGATVSAVRDGLPPLKATTDPSGYYTRTLLAGVYTVTASIYGYIPQTVAGVVVVTDTVTTQDFALQPAAMYVVSGTVTDATTGWPLYARIDIDGYPYGPVWTNPETGFYSIALAEGIQYTFHVSAWVDGYLPEDPIVGPLTGDQTENFALQADLATCNAPGYHPTTILDDDFDPGGFADLGWTVINNGGDCVWRDDNPGGRPNNTGGSGRFAIADSDYCGPGSYMDTELQSPAFDVSGIGTVILEFKSDYPYIWTGNDVLDVDVYDGSAWTNVLHRTGVAYPGPETVRLDITAAASGATNAQVRFHYYNANWEYWWSVDDVRIYGDCVPPANGGLVVGNVYDANTGAGLTGAQVANDSGYQTVAAATPEDPNVDDGFYTLFSPDGDHVFTATMSGGYQPDVETVNVLSGNTVRQDFHLPAGFLDTTPDSLDVTLTLGMSQTLPLTLGNFGGADAAFEVAEKDRGFQPTWRRTGHFAEPQALVPSEQQNARTTEGLNLPPAPSGTVLAAGDVIRSWTPASNPSAWGLAYTSDETVWVGEGWGTNHIDEYILDGTPTGRSWPYSWSPSYGPADDAFNWNTGMVWTLDVGSDNCLHEMDPAGGYTGNTICGPWGVSQRGVAYDPATDTWYVGGWNEQIIYHIDSTGNLLDSASVGLDIAGLAYNPDTQHLFVMVNGNPNPVYVLDASSPGYPLIGQFSVSQGFGPYAGAGLEFDCEGNLWAVDQSTNTVYQFESGETARLCAMDVPWLSEEPISGTVAAGTSLPVTVTFDAGVPEVTQPGRYYATLRFKNDTPYGTPEVPVTMTVLAPTTWGKLNGTVTGLGYCDANPAPLEGAHVHVESSQWVTGTVTVLSEDFESWPPAGWSIVNNGGTCVWESTATTGRPNYAGGQGQAADADSDWCGSGTTMDTELRMPVLDLSGYVTAALDFIASYNDFSTNDFLEVDVSSDGGTTWTNVLHWEEDHSDYGPGEPVSIDLTPYRSSSVVVRFRYVGAWDLWAEVDQVRITASGLVPVSWDLETDENGYYQLWLDESHSPLTVTVTADEHTGGMATGVIVSGQQTMTVDFDLRWLRPCVSADPTSLEATVLRGTSVTQPLTLTNNGAGLADFRLLERPGTTVSLQTSPISIPASDGNFPRGSAPVSIGRAPAGGESAAEATGQSVIPLAGEPAFAMNLFGGPGLVYIPDTTQPGTWTTIGSVGRWLFAGDFLLGDFSGMYALDYSTNQLYLVDTATAVPTLIGPSTPNPGQSWTGMTGATDGTLYASSTNIGTSYLYTIDPATGAATVVGEITNAPCIIDIAINAADEMYGVDICSDSLVRIDPATGAGTVIGPLGFDANYAQGMDFEERTGVLYLAAFNNVTSQGELRIADTSTGNTTLVGPFPGGAEVDCLAFKTGGTVDVPWLAEEPVTGTVSADSSTQVTITYTAFPTMSLGVYTATLFVQSNDPMNRRIGIPVTMTVVAAPTCSFLSSSPDDLGQTTYFTSTTDGTSPIIYAWNFGDGTLSTGKLTTHTYSLPGLYTVVLTATNEYGQDVCTGTVEVHGVVAGFTSNSPVMLGQPVVFTNTTVAYPEVVQWFWTFGDGAISAQENPTHTYATLGTYTVTLFAATVRGRPGSAMPLNVYDFYVDTVQVLGYDLELSPASALQSGRPGEVVTYTLRVTNTGNITDTYGVTVSGNAWTTSAPTTVGPVAPGTGVTFQVVVTVPTDALAGTSDTPTLRVISQGDPTKSAQSGLTTRALAVYGVELSPTSLSQSGRPGEVVTYTLTVTNTGNAADTFTVTMSGNSWTTSAPTTVGPVAPGAGATFQVAVTVPADALAGASDTATVRVTSKGDPTKSAQSSLTTRALAVYGLILAPASASQSGRPGEVVTYTLTVTNTGNAADAFTVTVSSTWAISVSVTARGTVVFPVAAGASFTVQVTVTIPITALAGASDTATVTVISQGDPTKSAQSGLTTAALAVYGVELSPTSLSQSGRPGEVVTYTLTVTNTGNAADTFTVTVSGNAWTTSAPTTVGPVAPGAGVTFQVMVAVPTGATGADTDTATVTVTSQANSSRTAQATLTTRRISYRLFLPLVTRNYRPQ